MTIALRTKVLAVFKIFAEGGSCARARAAVGLSGADFYSTLRGYPDLKQAYVELKESRGDMNADEINQIGDDLLTDKLTNPHAARAAIEAKRIVAGWYDRKSFGDKLQLEVEAGPSLLDALTARQRELLQPPSDLTAIAHQQVIDVESTIADPVRDKQSRAADQVADLTDPDDIFGP